MELLEQAKQLKRSLRAALVQMDTLLASLKRHCQQSKRLHRRSRSLKSLQEITA
jgi:hypothetical protein